MDLENGLGLDRKSTRLNSSHTVIYTLSLHDALPILLQGTLDQLVHVAAVAVDLRAPGDVLVDGFGEWVGLLEDHPHAAPDPDGVGDLGVDILVAEHDAALCARPGDHLVHPV